MNNKLLLYSLLRFSLFIFYFYVSVGLKPNLHTVATNMNTSEEDNDNNLEISDPGFVISEPYKLMFELDHMSGKVCRLGFNPTVKQ